MEDGVYCCRVRNSTSRRVQIQCQLAIIQRIIRCREFRHFWSQLRELSGAKRRWLSFCFGRDNRRRIPRDKKTAGKREKAEVTWQLSLSICPITGLPARLRLFSPEPTLCPGVPPRTRRGRRKTKVKHFQMFPRISLTSYYLLIWCHSPTVWGQLTSGVTGSCLKGHNLAEPFALK